MDVSGKNVLYVGGMGGIGVATAKVLLRKNIKSLVLLDRVENPEVLADLAKINPNAKLLFYAFDCTATVEQMTTIFDAILKEIHTFDILVNGAGIFNDRLVDATISINLAGVINTCIVAFKLWDKRTGGTGGVIVNVSSAAGIAPHPSIPVYSATKAGLIAFTKATAQLIALSGITTYALCPGPTNTALLAQLNSFLDYTPNVAALMASKDRQDVDTLAENILIAIERNQNGATWLMDDGKIVLVPDNCDWTVPDLYEKL